MNANATALYNGGQRRRLSEHPGVAEWREHMKAGEFWATVGEAWVGVEW